MAGSGVALGAASGNGGMMAAGLRLALADGSAENECPGARDAAPLRSQSIESIARRITDRVQVCRIKDE